MPTRAATLASIVWNRGKLLRSEPQIAPRPPPIVNSGASVPPDVPLPSATDQEISLEKKKKIKTGPDSEPSRMCSILSYPPPSVGGAATPKTPPTKPPIAGHHIQWTGR